MADSPIENARKILAAERRQGCQDRVVVGGLDKFLVNWRGRVAAEAEDPAALVLAERVVATLEDYAEAPPDDRGRRLDEALAMLDETRVPVGGAASARAPVGAASASVGAGLVSTRGRVGT
ncbi:MAG: hypothetical protein H0V51_00395, partial [Chloroflexi bacterium]|nr:hypothetical protein [Chloroflexota bacterium]